MLYKMVIIFMSVNETLCVTIQMKAIEQYFLVVLFIMLYMVVITFKPVCVWNPHVLRDHSIESFWEQYFHVVLFITCMLHKVVWLLTLKSSFVVFQIAQKCLIFNTNYSKRVFFLISFSTLKLL